MRPGEDGARAEAGGQPHRSYLTHSASLSRPSLDQVVELASRCGVTSDWLLGRQVIEKAMLEHVTHRATDRRAVRSRPNR